MRTRRSVEEGKALVEQFQRSGLSRDEFARQNGIAPHTLHYWIRKLGEAKHDLRFVEVLDGKETREHIALSIETGAVALRFNVLPDPAYLVDLTKRLGGC